jgi:hypothetical protein
VSARENVVLRWARLKRNADVARETVPAEEETAGRNETPKAPPRSEVPADQPFDLASLPSIESITGDTDISGFLRSGVPGELARAALRRVWASDPAIRDFIGIAENQWDFNDPNAIPGFGPLPQGEDLPAHLAQALGDHDQLAGMIPQMPAAAVPSLPATTIHHEPAVLDPDAQQASVGSPPSDEVSPSPAAGSNVDVAETDVSPRRRLHGGALPR